MADLDDIFNTPPDEVDQKVLWRGMQYMNQRLDHAIDLIGVAPDVKGNGGKGLLGEVAALKAKYDQIDLLKAKVVGMLMAGTVFLTVLWWLTKDKLGPLFGVTN